MSSSYKIDVMTSPTSIMPWDTQEVTSFVSLVSTMKGTGRFPRNNGDTSLNDIVDYNSTCADSRIIPALGKE